MEPEWLLGRVVATEEPEELQEGSLRSKGRQSGSIEEPEGL